MGSAAPGRDTCGAQALERLRAGRLVQEMAIDMENGGPVRHDDERMLILDSVEKRLRRHVRSGRQIRLRRQPSSFMFH